MSKRDTQPGMASQPRHVYGPRPVGALVPALTRPAFRRRAPGSAQLMADWAVIVGPKLAALTAPRRLSAGRLTIACTGPVAMELQHLATELIARINTHLGSALVERLGFVQAADAPEPPRVAASPAKLSAAEERRAEAAIAVLAPGELRDALAILGRAVLTAERARGQRRAKPSTPFLPKP